MKNLAKILGIGLSLAAALPAGCSQNMLNQNVINSIYENPNTCQPRIIVKEIQRPKVDGSLESWQTLYNSITEHGFPVTYELTPDEKKYFEYFIRQDPDKRKEILKKYKEKFKVLGEGSIKDIAFISNVK